MRLEYSHLFVNPAEMDAIQKASTSVNAQEDLICLLRRDLSEKEIAFIRSHPVEIKVIL